MVFTNNNINVISLTFYDKDNIVKCLLGCHVFQSDKKVLYQCFTAMAASALWGLKTEAKGFSEMVHICQTT